MRDCPLRFRPSLSDEKFQKKSSEERELLKKGFIASTASCKSMSSEEYSMETTSIIIERTSSVAPSVGL